MITPITELVVRSPEKIEVEGRILPCRIGRGGISPTGKKREGDLKTPSGSFAMRACYFRPDRVIPKASGLKFIELARNDGWCDDAADPMYNKPVKLPYAARHEQLWRDDFVYDLIIPLGYNDGPIVPGRGSAIFMHIMRPDGLGTEGCIGLAKEDLLALLPRFSPQTMVVIA